jgi:hypothetical protein
MAARTLASSFEDGPAMGWVAQRYGASVERRHVPEIGNNASQFGCIEMPGGHGRARYPGGDDLAEIAVGKDSFELSGAEVQAGDCVPVLSVACDALCLEDLCAVCYVCLSVLATGGPHILNGILWARDGILSVRAEPKERKQKTHTQAFKQPVTSLVAAVHRTDHSFYRDSHRDASYASPVLDTTNLPSQPSPGS